MTKTDFIGLGAAIAVGMTVATIASQEYQIFRVKHEVAALQEKYDSIPSSTPSSSPVEIASPGEPASVEFKRIGSDINETAATLDDIARDLAASQ